MRRVTTHNLNEVIKSNMMKPVTVTLRYSSNDIENIEPEKFIEYLEHLSKSGIFTDYIDWEYERIHVSDRTDYIMVHSRCLYFSIDVELQMRDGVSADDVVEKFGETIFNKVSA